MKDPNGKKENSCEGNLNCAEQTLHESVSQVSPDWVDENGECSSCVSLEHELADPTKLPDDLNIN